MVKERGISGAGKSCAKTLRLEKTWCLEPGGRPEWWRQGQAGGLRRRLGNRILLQVHCGAIGEFEDGDGVKYSKPHSQVVLFVLTCDTHWTGSDMGTGVASIHLARNPACHGSWHMSIWGKEWMDE